MNLFCSFVISLIDLDINNTAGTPQIEKIIIMDDFKKK